MTSNIVDLALAREARQKAAELRATDRWLELMLGDLGPPELAILELLDDEELEDFFRLRRRFREAVAEDLISKNDIA